MNIHNLTREQLIDMSFELMRAIVDYVPYPQVIDLATTPYSHLGTNNMTNEQLREHCKILYTNLHTR